MKITFLCREYGSSRKCITEIREMMHYWDLRHSWECLSASSIHKTPADGDDGDKIQLTLIMTNNNSTTIDNQSVATRMTTTSTTTTTTTSRIAMTMTMTRDDNDKRRWWQDLMMMRDNDDVWDDNDDKWQAARRMAITTRDKDDKNDKPQGRINRWQQHRWGGETTMTTSNKLEWGMTTTNKNWELIGASHGKQYVIKQIVIDYYGKPFNKIKLKIHIV